MSKLKGEIIEGHGLFFIVRENKKKHCYDRFKKRVLKKKTFVYFRGYSFNHSFLDLGVT